MPLPVEPLYSLDTVAQLVPTTKRSLESWMSRHRDQLGEPLYRRRGPVLWRVLRASEVVTIRNALVKTRAAWRERQRAARESATSQAANPEA